MGEEEEGEGVARVAGPDGEVEEVGEDVVEEDIDEGREGRSREARATDFEGRESVLRPQEEFLSRVPGPGPSEMSEISKKTRRKSGVAVGGAAGGCCGVQMYGVLDVEMVKAFKHKHESGYWFPGRVGARSLEREGASKTAKLTFAPAVREVIPAQALSTWSQSPAPEIEAPAGRNLVLFRAREPSRCMGQ